MPRHNRRSTSRLISIEPESPCIWARPEDFRKLLLSQPVVLINGAFDLLHASHLRLIKQARLRAGTLICALDSDKKIKANKVSGRPIMSWIERATAIGWCDVDYVVEISTDEDMKELIHWAQPAFRVQGAEYQDHKTRFPDVKRLFVRNGVTKTTDIIERCKNAG